MFDHEDADRGRGSNASEQAVMKQTNPLWEGDNLTRTELLREMQTRVVEAKFPAITLELFIWLQ